MAKEEKKKEEVSEEAAAKALEEAKNKRRQAFAEELKEVIKKHKGIIKAQPVFLQDGRVGAQPLVDVE